jgi:hypothetical protein
MKPETNIRERTIRVSGRVKIDTYRAGMVEEAAPYLERYRREPDPTIREYLRRAIEAIKAVHFIRTAVECPNLIMDSPNYGIDLIIQRLVGVNAYSLNVNFGEIGTGATTPALSDTGLTTPTNRAAVGFQQDFGQTDAIFQFFFSDSQLANQTYKEFGIFIDGTTSIGSGQIFNHALLSPVYEKAMGTDTTVQVDINVANS